MRAHAFLWSGHHLDFFTYGHHDLAHDSTTLPEIERIKHSLYFLFPFFLKKRGAINTDTFTKGIAIKKE